MKTIFALFDSYLDAHEAVEALLGQGFNEKEMNAVALQEAAKQNMDMMGVDLKQVNVDKSDKLGAKTVGGLTQLFGGEQPVHVSDTGDLLAGGELATMLVTQAAATGTAAAPLMNVLQEYGVPQDVAEAFRSGVNEGGVLFWIRTEDERAPVASNALKAENGKHVGRYS